MSFYRRLSANLGLDWGHSKTEVDYWEVLKELIYGVGFEVQITSGVFRTKLR